MKLGPNMPSTCHWIPSAALPTEWPHSTIATGAAVMRKLMRPKDTMPAATAIAKRGCHTISSKGRPPDRGASGANGAALRNATTTMVRRARGLRQEGAGEQQARNELPRPDHRLGSDD